MREFTHVTDDSCCGCTACVSICPVSAIVMCENQEGFFYPYVDELRCVSCGKCVEVCPVNTKHLSEGPLHIYAARNRNHEVRRKSSSGGIFDKLASWTEEQNGVIYGAAFDENFNVHHCRAERREEWAAFRIAKYVQSDLRGIFHQVKKDVKSGRQVLFSGTPCQVDGLLNYLGTKQFENLITCDILCHSVPSPMVWRDYLNYIQQKKHRSIGSISFRDKTRNGWHKSTLKVCDKNQQVLIEEDHSKNPFSKMFFSHYISRPSCYHCKYANMKRPGDISLGDFWGIEKHHPEWDDNGGISLVLVNTSKGQRMLHAISESLIIKKVSEAECCQPSLVRPNSCPAGRSTFWSLYSKYGFEGTSKRYGFLPWSRVEKLKIVVSRCLQKMK